jgi:hypothetical protein
MILKNVAVTIAILVVGMVLVVMVLVAIALTARAEGKTLRLPPSSARYQYDHDLWHRSGKAWIHVECPYGPRDDPGEASCQTVWARI